MLYDGDDTSVGENIEEPLLRGDEDELISHEDDACENSELNASSTGQKSEKLHEAENEQEEVGTENNETMLYDGDDTSVGQNIEEPLLRGDEDEFISHEEDDACENSELNASSTGQMSEKLNEAENEQEEDGTELLTEGMSGGADHDATSLEDDTTKFDEDDSDLLRDCGSNDLLTVEKEKDNREAGDISVEEIPSYTNQEFDQLDTELEHPVGKTLPFVSDRDSNQSKTDQNDEEKEYEQEHDMLMDGDELSQKSETSTLIDDNNVELTDSLLCNETNEREEDDEQMDLTGTLTEAIMPDNIDGYLQERDSDFDGISEVQNTDEMDNPPPYTERRDDDEDAEREDDPDRNDDGRENGFLEEQETYSDKDSLLPQYQDDKHRDSEDKSQIENISFYPHTDSNGEVMEQDDELKIIFSGEQTESRSQPEDVFSAGLADGGISGSFYGDDDMSSIFSDDGRDLSNILQENSILKEAMMQLRKDNPDGFTDTVSETSDEADEFYRYPYPGDTRMQTRKWMADKDFSDARLNEILREKRDSQAKMRQLEREKAMVERKYRQDKMERDFLEERFTSKSSKLEEEIRNLKQENQRLKRGGSQRKGTTPSAGNKQVGNTKELPVKGLTVENEDSAFPGRNGYAIDIAILAKENEKLSEIIDHLQDTPRNDPLNDFVENLDKYVPKDEYIKLENEKLKLETALREKERMLKEQERLIEETKFDMEEEIEILKDNLKKAENKNKEKTKLLSQNDIKMIDIKTKLSEKISKLEGKLGLEVSKKVKLESVIVNLEKCNGGFEKEIQDMNNRIQKLHKQEREMEAKNRRELTELKERLQKETEEKNKFARNVDALLQDLMQLKSKMLEDTEKHAKEKEELRTSFETEKRKMTAAQEYDNRRIKSELDDEKKRNQQLIRRMAEIPGETIVSVMENTTEAGLFESPVNDFEAAFLERTLQEEQYKEPEKDNMVIDLNDERSGSEGQLWNVPKPTEDNSGGINKLQRKLSEVSKYNGIMQRRNKEIEEENIKLKEKVEQIGRDVSKMRELEDKNEELQEDIAKNAKKRAEMQKKQENMMDEIEEITKKLSKVEGNNNDLSDEVDTLTKKIKAMEQEFTEEKSKLASSLEQEKINAIEETQRRLEEQKTKSKKLDNEIDDLQSDIKTLKDAKRAAEEKYVNDTRELVERHNSELTSERERYRQLQDELSNNAGAVRRVTEEWEQMLRNAVSRYEEDLQKNEDERRKMADEFLRQKEDMRARFDKEKAKMELRIQDIERRARSPFENEIMQENAAVSYQDPQTDLLFEDTPTTRTSFGDEGHNISNDIAENQEEINTLASQKRKLEQKLAQMQKTHDKEKNDLCNEYKKEKQKLEDTLTEDYKRRLDESKRYYEGLVEDLRRKHEKEEEELADKFKREKRELENKMKEDFSSNLSSRSAGLENKIQDLVSQKVQEQKDIAKKTEERCNTVLLQTKTRMKEIQNERNAMKREFEKEKKVLEATIQALTKELEKVKQEKKDLKKKQKKDKAEMEEAFENEKKEMKQIWEKCKLDTINQIEEEWTERVKSENSKSEIAKEELQGNFEARTKQMKLKFQAEKEDLERRLADAISASNALADAKKEVEASLEEDYRRKLQKEKENIESTLKGLRQEIERLQEHRKQLQNQMSNRESRANINAQPSLETNSKVLAKLDNEYQEHMKREKEHHESRMKEMEEEINRLHDDLSQMKVKARQEKNRVKAEFEKEREEIEEQFDKERNEWRTRMNFISMMQPREVQRVSLTFSWLVDRKLS